MNVAEEVTTVIVECSSVELSRVASSVVGKGVEIEGREREVRRLTWEGVKRKTASVERSGKRSSVLTGVAATN